MPVRNPAKIVDFCTKNTGLAEASVANVVAKLSTSDRAWLTAETAEALRNGLESTQKLINHALEKITAADAARIAATE